MKQNLIFSGPVYDSSGVAAFIRNQAKSFYKMKDRFKKVGIEPPQHMPYNENVTPELLELLNNTGDMDIKDSVYLQASWCEQWGPTLARNPKKFFGYTAVEGTKIPQTWVEAMNDPDVDGVLCMTEPLKKMWVENGAIEEKITVIGHGMEPKWFNDKVTAIDVSADLQDKFVFGYLNGWDLGKGVNDRKGPEILLKAFCEEFKPNEKVALLFAPNTIYGAEKDIQGAIDKIGLPKEHALIHIEDTNWKETDLGGVYKAMDCYVAPTKGEGFGITIVEAMACKVPVIVPNDPRSGHMDFCNEDTAHFFKIDGYEPINARVMGHLYSGSEWAMPSVADLRKVMRKVYEDREYLKSKAQAAHDLVHKEFTWDACTERILEAIK